MSQQNNIYASLRLALLIFLSRKKNLFFNWVNRHLLSFVKRFKHTWLMKPWSQKKLYNV